MTIERKNIIALRRYFAYLETRLFYIKLGFLSVDDDEFFRLKKSRQFYLKAFKKNIGFRKWLLEARLRDSDTDRDRYGVLLKLKNDILEFEENGIFTN